jgi:GNAT superfamily N-acetyltransferase
MIFRKAQENDLLVIIKLLADDHLGKSREVVHATLPVAYATAFEKINSDSNQELIVVVDDDGGIIGTFQLTYIQYLTYQGGIRAQLEAVRVREDQRGKGVGEKIVAWAALHAKEKGAHLLQLTSDKKRPDAIRFYEKVGFTASHEGMKLHL